jgi:hypothetical protein
MFARCRCMSQSLPTLPNSRLPAGAALRSAGGSGEHSGRAKRSATQALGPTDRSDLDLLTKQVGPVHRSVTTGQEALFKLRVNQLNCLRGWWALQGLNLRPLPFEGNSISRQIKSLLPVGMASHGSRKSLCTNSLRLWRFVQAYRGCVSCDFGESRSGASCSHARQDEAVSPSTAPP